MRWTLTLCAVLLSLFGCTTVVDEQRVDAVIQRGFNTGQPYVIRTRTLQGPQGTFEQTSVLVNGISAVCRIDNLQAMMKYVAKNGFEHHVAQVRGHYAGVLEEAISTYLDWDLYRHQ